MTVNVSLVRKMVPMKKDSYQRVYKPDGTYHHPKVPENILWKKGELYFQPMEILDHQKTLQQSQSSL